MLYPETNSKVTSGAKLFSESVVCDLMKTPGCPQRVAVDDPRIISMV